MNHAVAVARVGVAVGMRRFGITPAARIGHIHRIGGKGHGTILCHTAMMPNIAPAVRGKIFYLPLVYIK